MASTRTHTWRLPDRTLTIGRRPLIMGIVNVTPDSFSDGGKFLGADRAVAHALELVEQGADILDVGGESSRPGATPVPVEDELARVIPVIRDLAPRVRVPISIDTYKADVARQALRAGALIVNDISGLTADAEMASVAREAGAGLVVMHMQGTPQTMQLNPQYADVVGEIRNYLKERLAALRSIGIEAERVSMDPGIGFGKKLEHNLELLARLGEFQELGRPICLGVSRKGFINRVLGQPGLVEQGTAGTLGVLLYAVAHEAVQIIRVHDVAATRAAMTLFTTLADRASRQDEDESPTA